MSSRVLEPARQESLTAEAHVERAICLAEAILVRALAEQPAAEKSQQAELARMMDDANGRVFVTAMTDQAFRTESTARVANQINYLLRRYGVPRFASFGKRLALSAFAWLSPFLHRVLVPMTKSMLRQEMSRVILPGEYSQLGKHMAQRRKQGVRVNLNHLGEAILGEEEAEKRLRTYIRDLERPEVEYISVKVSTICSQLNMLAWEATLERLCERFRSLLRTAEAHQFLRADGQSVPKFVNLDMEEYRDLHLTVELFMRVLSEPEFLHCSAGIVLQAYLPDSFSMQQALTEWAMQRAAPIKIRLVKGANLAMERVDASVHGWPQAPYKTKAEVDANYKRMVAYGCQPEHAVAARLGIASHNLFDAAFALVLREDFGVQDYVEFEMLEGMADHLRRAVHAEAGDMLLYCPSAEEHEFQHAVAYLVRRLDENTAPENFLRHQFGLRPGSRQWDEQVELFRAACAAARQVSAVPRRTQDRHDSAPEPCVEEFCNEPDTDWSLSQNRRWAEEIVAAHCERDYGVVPLWICGEEIQEGLQAGYDPSYPERQIYQHAMAGEELVQRCLACAERAQSAWSGVPVQERVQLAQRAAQLLRDRRAELLGIMLADGGKILPEADVEVSEAIDFAEYYARSLEDMTSIDGITWMAKGVTVVTPPWNFPLAIPFGGCIAALLAGNAVIFKPARETALIGYQVAKILWDAGFPKEVLQFLLCEDHSAGNALISDARVKQVILTGATETARHFLKIHPGLDLMAETGGKNAMIVSSLCDRDLALKSVVQSAFGHAGQKCSASSLLILEAEVYDDPKFKRQLRDTAASLKVGSAWDLDTLINPLIHPPTGALAKGLELLEDGESWLLKPQVDPQNPRLWSPGIKWGVKAGNFTYRTELFGPVLSVVRAVDLEHAIELVNGVEYGLTSGLQSLDLREQKLWASKIEAGNLYINRGITGAIVRRQPFGGTKQSGFGRGSKAGGPNYLSQLMNAAERSGATVDYQQAWDGYFSRDHDPSQLVGQDNLLRYVPHRKVILRVSPSTTKEDIRRVKLAAQISGTPLEISEAESEAELIDRLPTSGATRLYMTEAPSEAIWAALIPLECRLHVGKPLANGRLELLNFLREVSLCVDYHRYGNLEDRESEPRRPVL